MSALPTACRSVRTRQYKKQLAGLPTKIQELADLLFKYFEKNPDDPRLKTGELHDSNKKGKHRHGSKSVELTLRYRAIYVMDNGVNGDEETQACWYWVGSHEDYNNFTK